MLQMLFSVGPNSIKRYPQINFFGPKHQKHFKSYEFYKCQFLLKMFIKFILNYKNQ
jgi:hypothetical protein